MPQMLGSSTCAGRVWIDSAPFCTRSPMREWSEELLAGDAFALGRRHCGLLARLTSVVLEPI